MLLDSWAFWSCSNMLCFLALFCARLAAFCMRFAVFFWACYDLRACVCFCASLARKANLQEYIRWARPKTKLPNRVLFLSRDASAWAEGVLGGGSGHVAHVIEAAAGGGWPVRLQAGTFSFAACSQRHCFTNSPTCPTFCEVALPKPQK